MIDYLVFGGIALYIIVSLNLLVLKILSIVTFSWWWIALIFSPMALLILLFAYVGFQFMFNFRVF